MFNKEAIEQLQKADKPFSLFFAQAKDEKGGVPCAAVPEDYTLKSLKPFFDEYLKKPERRKGTVSAYDLASFIALTNRWKAPDSVLFQSAKIQNNGFEASLQSILNYDPATSINTDADNCDHRVTYQFPLSPELKTWLGKNKQPFSQIEFSQFLEDNIADLVKALPDKFVTKFADGVPPAFSTPSTIFALARGIECRTEEKIVNEHRNADGSFTVQWTQENKGADGKPLTIPEWFALGIPVFEGGECYQIPCRLRFRKKEGSVFWYYEFYRKEDIFNQAFNDACGKAASGTGLPIFNGAPKA